MRSFVLGNGRSRLRADLTQLKRYGKIYGCNALYREFTPDYLIAVDPKMIFEIEESKYQIKNEVWTNPNAKYKKFVGFRYFVPSLGWSSGPTALHLAAKHRPKEIYILGFDYAGENGHFNNVYADTRNYKSAKDVPTYHGNWENQTSLVIKEHKDINFFRVVDKDFYNVGWTYPNFKQLTYKNFFGLLQTWSKTR